MIFLDHAATTPIHPAAAEALARAAVDYPGNPGSQHTAGRHAAKALAAARAVMADSIGARPDEIILTAGGTEANNLVIGGVVAWWSRQRLPVHVVTTATEHASVEKRLAWEERQNPGHVRVTRLPVNRDGRIDPENLAAAIGPDTRLVSILHGNNETGALHDLDAIKTVMLSHPAVPLHLDWVQSYGKVPVDVRTFPVDFLTVAAHKVGGPQGAGFVFARQGRDLEPMTVGGAQETYRRAGTPGLAAAAGFAAAIQAAPPPAEAWSRLAALEAAFLTTLAAEGAAYHLNGPPSPGKPDSPARLPGLFNLAFPGVADKQDLLIALDLDGVMASAVSACHSGVVSDSTVLAAMRVPPENRSSSIRVGLNHRQSESEITEAARRVAKAVLRITQACQARSRP